MSITEAVFVLFQVFVGVPTVILYFLTSMHMKPEYMKYFWLGYWLFNAKSIEKEGQKYRKISLVLIALYGIGNVIIMKMLERSVS